MLIRTAVVLFALAGLLCAEETPASTQQAKVTRIIHVHGNAEWLGNLARTPGGASVMVNDNLHVVVANGTAAAIAEVERIIHELDVNADAEKKDVELTFYLLSGSHEASPASAEPESPSLAPVYRQLRTIFPLKTYQVVNTMFMRSRDSREAPQPQISGMLRPLTGSNGSASNMPGTYQISCSASADASSVIHVTRLSFGLKIPVGPQLVDVGVETKLDLREGQKVVVGTSNVEPGEVTLFLVLSAHILP